MHRCHRSARGDERCQPRWQRPRYVVSNGRSAAGRNVRQALIVKKASTHVDVTAFRLSSRPDPGTTRFGEARRKYRSPRYRRRWPLRVTAVEQ